MEALVARNPATGDELGRYQPADPRELEAYAAAAAQAQRAWAALPCRRRCEILRAWYRLLSRDADAWAHSIVAEIGKPRPEAMAEVVATLDAIRWTLRHAPAVLRPARLGPAWQRWLLMGAARVTWLPQGVVGLIGTWNYPLLLNAAPLAQALAAGNAAVWKPSELACFCGDRLRRGFAEAGLPAGLVTTAMGGPDVGQALCDVANHILFTGGIATGRQVLARAGARGIPAVAELSGFDPAIVLPDAPFDRTVQSLTWGAFAGAGQTCVAIKRVYVVGESHRWAEALAARARALRIGDPASPGVDMGPLISAVARARCDAQIQAAVRVGAQVLTGAEPLPGVGAFYAPTVLWTDSGAGAAELAGVFGPVVIVQGVADAERAIEEANRSEYGLAASVWGTDRRALRHVAERIEAGMVTINDAVAPAGHASAPFGGVKASGFGRTRGAWGLRELARPQAIHFRRPGGLRPHLFPYGSGILRLLDVYRRFFHHAPR
jgi:acyl-CoA reductase-like NAD-dependent aldehyde dehydrogenase